MVQALLLMPTNKLGKAARFEGYSDFFCTRNKISLRPD